VIRRWCAGDPSTSGVAGHWFGLAENKGDGDGCAGLGSVAMVFPCGTLFSASSGVFRLRCGTPVTRTGTNRGAGPRGLLCKPKADFRQTNPVRSDQSQRLQAKRPI